jgi:transcriptional regulator with XRE-family HTH domain
VDALERFGVNLLRIRQARRLSQESLAERAGVHRTQISLLETGQRQPLLETLIRLAGALEIPLPALLEGIAFKSGPGEGEFVVSDPPELPRVGVEKSDSMTPGRRGECGRIVAGGSREGHGSVTDLRPRHRDAGNVTLRRAFLMPTPPMSSHFSPA